MLVKGCIHRSLHFAQKSSNDFFSLKTDLINVQLFKNNPARYINAPNLLRVQCSDM